MEELMLLLLGPGSSGDRGLSSEVFSLFFLRVFSWLGSAHPHHADESTLLRVYPCKCFSHFKNAFAIRPGLVLAQILGTEMTQQVTHQSSHVPGIIHGNPVRLQNREL